jgi:general secretion pathway protein F
MPRFNYQALDSQGQAVSGVLEASTERDAARQLKRRDLTLTQLQSSAVKAISRQQTDTLQKPKARDVLMVLHEVTTLLESDVSLIDTIESIAESTHPPFIVQTFSDMATKLRQGMAFSQALNESPLELPWYVMQLLEAGEMTGKVAPALRDALTQMEYEARVGNEMRNAMIYPSVLIFSGVTAVLLIFIVVVPRFAGILNGRGGGDIPWLASTVINTGMYLNNHWLMLAIGTGAFVLLLSYLWQQENIKIKVRDGMTQLPVVGVWILELETGRWAGMLSTLLENRVPLLKALELARTGIQVPSLKARLGQVSKAVRAGTHLSQALQDNAAITSTGHNLVRAGEKAGKLPKMLRSLANLYEDSGRTRMKRMLLLIEPAAILIIGSVIGVIITGVILAITSVNEVGF